MGWDTRGNRRYYYGRRVVGGATRRVYLGHGRAGRRAAAEDQARRVQQREQVAQLAALRAQVADAQAVLLDACDRIELHVRAALLAEGYHQHQRGAWRKRRDG